MMMAEEYGQKQCMEKLKICFNQGDFKMNGINEIKQITLGALRVYEKDGYVCFSRFTEKQEKDLWDYGCGTKIFCSCFSVKREKHT